MKINSIQIKVSIKILSFALIAIFGCTGKNAIRHGEKNQMQNDILIKEKDTLDIKKDTVLFDDTVLSPASLLMIKACDNYLIVNDSGQKAADVMNIKASLLYNKRLYERSRNIYNQIISKFPKTTFSTNAMEMIAQTYYEEKKFNEAQEWYRKLSNEVESVPDKQDAMRRIAESIYRMAESYEEQNKFKEAVAQYERVSLEFPQSNIADIALFNAGLVYDKLTEWTHAILIFKRLIQKFPDSKLLAKAQFRIAKSHEKLLQWDYAAEAYLKVVIEYKSSELGPLAMYNAGFCFESADKQKEAAATFEKLAFLFPDAPDAPDVLFKAGEIYGKIKDWESVSRVNRTFTDKFGNDEDRIIQVLCMSGIALYMQNRDAEAIKQLEKAEIIYGKLKQTSNVNAYYTAKALYTLGEIYHAQMVKTELSANKNLYKKELEKKSSILDKAIESYSKVIKFSISEWTTRSVFQIGQAYEDFGIGIFKQDRPPFKTYEDRMALELGIAKAVEQFFVDKSVYYHELNVKLGIKEKIDDKFITQSRQKLTYLPYMAAENYVTLVEITKNSQGEVKLEGFSSIAKTLQIFQKIAPFQEKAIELYLKCLELGSKYNEINEFYNNASSNITGYCLSVGQTYDKVVTIARDAPIPENFSTYEKFIYKTKLLKQVENYEDDALKNYLKAIKIAEAYTIEDKSIKEAQQLVARLLFNKARCYDLLAEVAYEDQPYPDGISEVEKEEFNISFSEIGDKFQAQAVEIYKSILELVKQKYASGEYVQHSYMRLFQILPNVFGVADSIIDLETVKMDSLWTCSGNFEEGWFKNDFNDSEWHIPEISNDTDSLIKGFPGKNVPKISFVDTVNQKCYFRRKINCEDPCSLALYINTPNKTDIYINGKNLPIDSSMYNGNKAYRYKPDNLLKGNNCVAVEIQKNLKSIYELRMEINIWEKKSVMLPMPPGTEKPLTEESQRNLYKFPSITNFSLDKPLGLK